MSCFTVLEASKNLGIPKRKLYDYIKKIEERSNYKFDREHCGHFSFGREKKQIVITTKEIELFKEFVQAITIKKTSISRAINEIFVLNEWD